MVISEGIVEMVSLNMEKGKYGKAYQIWVAQTPPVLI